MSARASRGVLPVQRLKACEKALKKWNRVWKFRLIEEGNPDWFDLFNSLNA